MNKSSAKEALLLVKQKLDELKISFWLTDGTLLGAIRENDFISHDSDIDIGIQITDYDPKIIGTLTKVGFKLRRTHGALDNGYELTFSRREIRVDVFFFYREDDYYWHAAWYIKKRFLGKKILKMLGLVKPKILKYKYDLFVLKKYSFVGAEFNIPEDPIRYLLQKYGENWRVPDKNWDWKFSPKNLFYVEE